MDPIAAENNKIWDEKKYINEKGEIQMLDVDNLKIKFIGPDLKINPPKDPMIFATKFDIIAKSTVEVAIMLQNYSTNKKMILNFASGRHPGGGYITGAIAQEECLCRASGLYPCLVVKKAEFHDAHKETKSPEYSDAIIYVENVPFFRDQNNRFLNTSMYYDVLSCAAINQSQKKSKNALTLMEKRIKRILYIAYVANAKILILGSFGCGVFAGDPQMIADIFYRCLQCEFKNCFELIVFAILPNPKSDNITPFEYQFRKLLKPKTTADDDE